MEFKENLKTLRKQKGVSQEELGENIGVKKSVISLYESGKRKPSFEVLEAIADYFNVDMNVLMGNSDMSFQEAELLNYFRMVDPNHKEAILSYAKAMAALRIDFPDGTWMM